MNGTVKEFDRSTQAGRIALHGGGGLPEPALRIFHDRETQRLAAAPTALALKKR
jgi:hypothetical protein